MTDISIQAAILKEIADWAEDQANLDACEVRLNFLTGDLELHDCENNIMISSRSLEYFVR